MTRLKLKLIYRCMSKFNNSKRKGPQNLSTHQEFEILKITNKSYMFGHFHSVILDVRFKERCAWIINKKSKDEKCSNKSQ